MRVFSEPGVLVDKVLPEPRVLVNLEGIDGVLLVIFSAICFGTNPIFARLSYEAGTNPTNIVKSST